MCRNVTFLCGQPGIYALGAVAAKLKNDPLRRDFYLNLFNKVLKLLPNTTLDYHALGGYTVIIAL